MKQIRINGLSVSVQEGVLLHEVLLEHSDFKMPCAGQGHCGKCRVKAAGQLSEPDSVEQKVLTETELAAGIRLACRTKVYGPAEVFWEKQESKVVLLAETQKESDGNGHLSGKSGSSLFRKLGAAVDIGTTTLAAGLYNNKGMIAQAGCDNPQAAFGADVISRIEASLSGKAGKLAEAVRSGINGLLEQMCRQNNLSPEQIDTLVITGNTVMLYLLTERNPDCLSHSPFQADWLADEWISAQVLGLCCPAAKVYLPPCISAFVGADITTALLEADVAGSCEREGGFSDDREMRCRLLVDIGTNGEIALWKNGQIFCCATAAGPAFEGAGISRGMQGEKGAISHVKLDADGRFKVEVIGMEYEADAVHKDYRATYCGETDDEETDDGKMIRGICGSGVIDAVRCLLEGGYIDETGYMEDDEVILAGDVGMSQEDIRQVQLAKSAICAGMETLLAENGLEYDELDELLIAGGFGAYLDLESAEKIGLLPKGNPGKIRVLGNAALAGAAKLLMSVCELKKAREIAAGAVSCNLAENPKFADRYMEGMFFDK